MKKVVFALQIFVIIISLPAYIYYELSNERIKSEYQMSIVQKVPAGLIAKEKNNYPSYHDLCILPAKESVR